MFLASGTSNGWSSSIIRLGVVIAVLGMKWDHRPWRRLWCGWVWKRNRTYLHCYQYPFPPEKSSSTNSTISFTLYDHKHTIPTHVRPFLFRDDLLQDLLQGRNRLMIECSMRSSNSRSINAIVHRSVDVFVWYDKISWLGNARGESDICVKIFGWFRATAQNRRASIGSSASTDSDPRVSITPFSLPLVQHTNIIFPFCYMRYRPNTPYFMHTLKVSSWLAVDA